MSLIVNNSNNVIFDGIKIGKIEVRENRKCFIAFATYERHIYRKLNSWTTNLEVVSIPELRFLLWDVSSVKVFGISVSKLNKFMGFYDNKIRGFKGYKSGEVQIAVPVSICDSYDTEYGETKKGASIREFIEMVDDPHTIYHEWKKRMKK